MQRQPSCGIHKFVERDIDMLLAAELRVNPVFSEWIIGHYDIASQIIFPAIETNVSVVEDGSEADVVATFTTKSGKKHRLFVENKIDAKLMPQQLQRYIRRAEGGIATWLNC